MRFANRSDARRELLERLERVLQPLKDEIRDGDPTELEADALAQNPRDAELAVRDLVFGKVRHLPGRSFERLDDHGPSVGVDGLRFHRAQPTVGRAMSVFGPVECRRCRSRPDTARQQEHRPEPAAGKLLCLEKKTARASRTNPVSRQTGVSLIQEIYHDTRRLNPRNNNGTRLEAVPGPMMDDVPARLATILT